MKKVHPKPNARIGRKEKRSRDKTASKVSSGAGDIAPNPKFFEEHSEELKEQPPILDERVPGLLLDSLEIAQAALLCSAEGLPYPSLREAIALSAQEKTELVAATQTFMANYSACVAKHRNALEFATVVTRVMAGKMDVLLRVMESGENSPSPGGHVCSRSEALCVALVILAPLGILGLALLVKHLRRIRNVE